MATAKLTAELGMDGKGFTKGTKKAGKEVKTFSDKLGGLKTAMAGAFSVGVITAFTKSAIAAGSEIFHMAEQVGLSAEQFQVLSHTVERAGGKKQQLVNILNRLRDAQGRVIQGDKRMIEMFEFLGISMKTVEESTVFETLEHVARAATEANFEGAEFSALTQILGMRDAPRLKEALQRLATDGFGKLREETKSAVGLLANDTVKALADAEDAIDDLQDKMTVFAGWRIAWWMKTFGNLRQQTAFYKDELPPPKPRKKADVGGDPAAEERRRVKAGAEDRYFSSARERGLNLLTRQNKQLDKDKESREKKAAAEAKKDRILARKAEQPSVDQLARIGIYVGGAQDPQAGFREKQIRLEETQIKVLLKISSQLAGGPDGEGGLGE